MTCMLHFDMNLYYVYLESRILMSFLYSLLLYVLFLFWVCTFVILVTIIISFQYLQVPAWWALAFLVACRFVLDLYYLTTVYSVYGKINMMMMMMILGRSTPDSDWHSRAVTMFDVLIVKSSDCTDLLSNAHTSRASAYSRIAIHLRNNNWTTTSSEANRRTLPKIPLTAQ